MSTTTSPSSPPPAAAGGGRAAAAAASRSAVRAFASDDAPLSESDFIGKWMSQIAPAAAALATPRADTETYLRQLEFASVELSLKNLMTFPFVKTAVEQGELTLHGAYFGVASGRLLVRDEKTGSFEPV